tara:strand:+ start:542 stop:709 length:168 start_codon:yes stop_codon:yes gene_type:complete
MPLAFDENRGWSQHDLSESSRRVTKGETRRKGKEVKATARRKELRKKKPHKRGCC